MREIKFRAWDKRKEKKLHWDQICVQKCMTADSTVVYERRSDEWHPNGDLVLMQFTGLKDKNGKEIYEGDIIKNHRFPDDLLVVRNFIEDVYWLKELSKGEKNKPAKLEIIGNIYESPELLAAQ